MAQGIISVRQPALAEVMVEDGICPHGTPVVGRAGIEDVKGRVVYGILPLHLAAAAESLVVADLRIPEDQRGKELTKAEVREYLRGYSEYRVQRYAAPRYEG